VWLATILQFVPTTAVIFAARTGVRRVAIIKSRSLLLRGCE
jgi:hypothetical protein